MATRLGKLIATAALACILCVGAGAQTNTANQPEKDAKTDSFLSVDSKTMQEDDLEPNIRARLGRMWQYQYQFAEQPALVVASVNGSNQIIPNPEAYLQQHTLSFQLSELVPGASDLAAIVAAYAAVPANASKELQLNRKLCHVAKAPTIACLAAGGTRFWERFLSGVSGNGSWAERNELQQGIVSAQSFSQHYGPAGEIDFDPASLFITGTNWKTALGALKNLAVPKEFFTSDDDEARCFLKPEEGQSVPKGDLAYCVKIFASPRLRADKRAGVGTRLAAGLIPKFQFKATDQYDFLKNGGVLIPVPGLQRSLKSYTFTADLRRIFPSAADRAAVIASYRSYSKPPVDGKTVNEPKVCITMTGNALGYVPLGGELQVDDCREIATRAGADKFALACATTNSLEMSDFNSKDARGGDLQLPKKNKCGWARYTSSVAGPTL